MKSKKLAPRRARLYDLQGGRCAHCGHAMLEREATIEHVVPRSRGGTDAWTNLLVAHKRCNERRGSHPLWRRARNMHKRILEQIALAA